MSRPERFFAGLALASAALAVVWLAADKLAMLLFTRFLIP